MGSPIIVKIKRLDPITVAFLSVTGHFSQIPDALGKLYGWISWKGYEPKGPAITVYYKYTRGGSGRPVALGGAERAIRGCGGKCS